MTQKSTDLSAEVTRAIQAENILGSGLYAEVARAKAAVKEELRLLAGELVKYEKTNGYDLWGLKFGFPNGWGASVIKDRDKFGRLDGSWELAVLNRREEIDYSTEITSDVLQHLQPDEVKKTLERIAALDACPS